MLISIAGGPVSEHVPCDEDFLVSYSTLPGNFAYRDPEEGTFYIQAFVETMQRYASMLHMIDILQKVTEEVKRKIAALNEAERREDALNQLPFYVNSLHHSLCLTFPDVSAHDS